MAQSPNVTFTMDLETIAKLADLSARTGKNKSELVREAVALLYAKHEPIIAVIKDDAATAIVEALAKNEDRRR